MTEAESDTYIKWSKVPIAVVGNQENCKCTQTSITNSNINGFEFRKSKHRSSLFVKFLRFVLPLCFRELFLKSLDFLNSSSITKKKKNCPIMDNILQEGRVFFNEEVIDSMG